MTTDTRTDPHNGTPVFGEPIYDAQVAYDDIFGEPTASDPDAVRWDLSGGACLSFGRHEDDGPLLVNLSLGDYALQAGIVQRVVTREQVLAYARHLLRLVGAEPTFVLPETTP